MNYNNKLKTNNENLNSILNTINSLPQNPQLTNPALETDILLGKDAIVDGEKIVGKIQYYTNDKVVVSSYDGTTISTSGKYNPYDLRIELDASLIPSGTLEVTENGEHDVTNYEKVNVNVEESGGITLDMIAQAQIAGEVTLNATTIASYAFTSNTGITSLYAPNVTTISTYAFYNTTNLNSIYLPNCTTISTYCFRNTQVSSLSLPECTSIGGNSFTTPNKLTVLDLPKCKTIGASAFAQSLITRLVVPECTSIGNSALSNCKQLTFADLGKCKSLERYALRNNGNLGTVILRSETICVCALNVLDGTKISKSTGYIYVPRALLSDTDATSDYRQATNWARFSTQFRVLEDYTVDGTITGELDLSKI